MRTGVWPDVTAKSSHPRAHWLVSNGLFSSVGCFLDPYEAIAPPSAKRSWKNEGNANELEGASVPAQTSRLALTGLVGVGQEIE
jgi:hypothetical protein